MSTVKEFCISEDDSEDNAEEIPVPKRKKVVHRKERTAVTPVEEKKFTAKSNSKVSKKSNDNDSSSGIETIKFEVKKGRICKKCGPIKIFKLIMLKPFGHIFCGKCEHLMYYKKPTYALKEITPFDNGKTHDPVNINLPDFRLNHNLTKKPKGSDAEELDDEHEEQSKESLKDEYGIYKGTPGNACKKVATRYWRYMRLLSKMVSEDKEPDTDRFNVTIRRRKQTIYYPNSKDKCLFHFTSYPTVSEAKKNLHKKTYLSKTFSYAVTMAKQSPEKLENLFKSDNLKQLVKSDDDDDKNPKVIYVSKIQSLKKLNEGNSDQKAKGKAKSKSKNSNNKKKTISRKTTIKEKVKTIKKNAPNQMQRKQKNSYKQSAVKKPKKAKTA